MAGRGDSGEVWMDALAPYARRRFAAARLRPRAALLVVDMQRFFVDADGDAYLPMGRAALPQVRALLSAFRAEGLPVVFTRHEDRPGDLAGAMGRWWGSIMEPEDPQLEITADLEVDPADRVIRKHQYSAFHETGLADLWRQDGVKSVVVCGVMTHLCCETSARDAFMEDFDVVLAVDAMGSSGEELHLAALKTLVDGFGVPALSHQITAALAPLSGR